MCGQQKVWNLLYFSVFLLGLWITPGAALELSSVTLARDIPFNGQLAFTVLGGSEFDSEDPTTEVEKAAIVLLQRGRDLRKVNLSPVMKGSAYPSFSSDGQKLAFTSVVAGKRQIFVENLAASGPVQITDCARGCDNAVWQPESETLFFYVEQLSKKATRLASVSLNSAPTTGPRSEDEFRFLDLHSDPARNTTPTVGQGGDRVLYSTNLYWPGWDICLFSVSSKSNDCLLTGVQSYCRPRFSPSGKSFAYSAGFSDRIGIYSYRLDNQQTEKLVDLPGKDYDIAFKDEESLFFTSQNGDKNFGLYLYSSRQKEPKMIAHAPTSIRFLSYSR